MKLLFLFTMAACRPTPDTGDSRFGPEGPPALVLGALHSPSPGSTGHVFPRDDGFLLGAVAKENAHTLQDFDDSWQSRGEPFTLSEPGPREPDMKLVESRTRLFHVRLDTDDRGPGLRVQRRDDQLEVEATSSMLAEGDDERSLDPSLLVSEDRVWVGTEFREDAESWDDNIPPDPELERGLLLRELSLDLELLATHHLTAELPEADPADRFWGLGTAQLRDRDGHWVLVAAPTGDAEHFDQGESEGTRRLFALEYDHDLVFREAHGPLTPEGIDAYWCTGLQRVGEHTLLSYTFRRPEDGPVLGPPSSDYGNIALLLLDADHQVVERLELSDHSSLDIAKGLGAHRSNITVEGDQAWVSWDDPESIRVQEIELVWP